MYNFRHSIREYIKKSVTLNQTQMTHDQVTEN